MPSPRQSIILGAVVTALVGVILAFPAQSGNPVLGFVACCLPAIIGGLLVTWHYTNTHGVPLNLGSGAKYGAVTAALGAVGGAVLQLLLTAVGVFPNTAERIEMQRDRMLEQGMTEEQIEQGMQMVEFFTGPGGQAISIAIGVVLFALIGALGGLIGAKVFGGGNDAPAASPEI